MNFLLLLKCTRPDIANMYMHIIPKTESNDVHDKQIEILTSFLFETSFERDVIRQ